MADANNLNLGGMEDSIQPVFDAGMVYLVDLNHKVCDEVYLEPTTGHTPEHVRIHTKSED